MKTMGYIQQIVNGSFMLLGAVLSLVASLIAVPREKKIKSKEVNIDEIQS